MNTLIELGGIWPSMKNTAFRNLLALCAGLPMGFADGAVLASCPVGIKVASSNAMGAKPPPVRSPNPIPPSLSSARGADDRIGPWHVDVAVTTAFPRLESTKRRLDRRLDVPLKTDFARAFDSPETPIDRRTALGLNSLYVGLGRRRSARIAWTWYVGAAAGADRNHQRRLARDLRVNFRYGYYFTGLRTELYPAGYPRAEALMSWPQRLRASRPFLYAGIETGYISAEGEGRFKFLGRRIYKDGQKVRDWVIAGLIGAGLHVPINLRWSIMAMGGYQFHAYRPEEYNGWNVVAALRLRF